MREGFLYSSPDILGRYVVALTVLWATKVYNSRHILHSSDLMSWVVLALTVLRVMKVYDFLQLVPFCCYRKSSSLTGEFLVFCQVKAEDLPARVLTLLDEIKSVRSEVSELQAKLATMKAEALSKSSIAVGQYRCGVMIISLI